MLKVAIAQLGMFVAHEAFILAHAYQTAGVGLNPVVAYPLATVMVIIPWIVVLVDYLMREEDEFEHIVMEGDKWHSE